MTVNDYKDYIAAIYKLWQLLNHYCCRQDTVRDIYHSS